MDKRVIAAAMALSLAGCDAAGVRWSRCSTSRFPMVDRPSWPAP